MIVAVDTNVFLDILRPNPAFVDTSLALLERTSAEGDLVVCGVVYAELAANFSRQADLDVFLSSVSTRVDPLDPISRYRAGRAWRAYRAAGGKRDRILPDFMIGAHASEQASSLLSRDRGFFGSYFPHLTVLDR